MKNIEKFAGNSFYLFLDSISVTLLSFIFWVIVWKTLPPDSAGIIATSLNTIIIITIIGTFGIPATLEKLISEYSRRNALEKTKSLLNFSYRLVFPVSIALSIGYLSFAIFSGFDLKIPVTASILVAIGVLTWPLTQVTNGALVGFQRMKDLFKTNFTSQLIKPILAIALIFFGFEFFGPLSALVISSMVLIVLRKDVISLGLRARAKINKAYVVSKYSLPAFVSNIALALFVNTPVIILTVLNSLHESGIFAAAVSMASPLLFVPNILTAAFFPIISGLMVRGGREKIQANMMKSVIRYTSLFTFPLLAIYIFFAKGFVLVLANLDYLEAVQYLPIIGVATVILGFGWMFVTSLYAIRRTEENRNIVALTAAIFLTLSIPMTIEFGTIGLITSYLISVSVLTVLGYFRLKRYLNLSIPWKDMGKIVLASVVLFSIMLPSEVLEFKLIEKLPLITIGLAMYLLVLLRLRFFDQEDVYLISLLQKKFPLLGKSTYFILRLLKRYSAKAS